MKENSTKPLKRGDLVMYEGKPCEIMRVHKDTQEVEIEIDIHRVALVPTKEVVVI